MDKYGLSQQTISSLYSLFKNYQCVDKVILYGSRAKGVYEKFSDIDITLIGSNITKDNLRDIIFDIDDLLLPYSFDVSIFSEIRNPDVVAHIERVGKVLYENIKLIEIRKELIDK